MLAVSPLHSLLCWSCISIEVSFSKPFKAVNDDSITSQVRLLANQFAENARLASRGGMHGAVRCTCDLARFEVKPAVKNTDTMGRHRMLWGWSCNGFKPLRTRAATIRKTAVAGGFRRSG